MTPSRLHRAFGSPERSTVASSTLRRQIERVSWKRHVLEFFGKCFLQEPKDLISSSSSHLELYSLYLFLSRPRWGGNWSLQFACKVHRGRWIWYRLMREMFREGGVFGILTKFSSCSLFVFVTIWQWANGFSAHVMCTVGGIWFWCLLLLSRTSRSGSCWLLKRSCWSSWFLKCSCGAAVAELLLRRI